MPDIPKPTMIWLCPARWTGHGLIDLDLDACPTGPKCYDEGCQKDKADA